MNKCLKLVACMLLVCGTAISAFAQASASATATSSATIVTPIAISNVTALDFGNVAVNGNLGTVVMPATSAGLRTRTGGVTLPIQDGTHSSASFLVTGNTNYAYSVVLSNTPVTLTGAGIDMVVDGFTSSVGGTGTLTAGSQTIYVGATLNVAGAQVAGLYTSVAPFTVTVDYN